MELSYRFIDLHKTQQTTHGYADIIPRESMKGAWYVPKYTLLADEQHWQVVTSGKLVEVPLVPYITPPNTLSVFGESMTVTSNPCSAVAFSRPSGWLDA